MIIIPKGRLYSQVYKRLNLPKNPKRKLFFSDYFSMHNETHPEENVLILSNSDIIKMVRMLEGKVKSFYIGSDALQNEKDYPEFIWNASYALKATKQLASKLVLLNRKDNKREDAFYRIFTPYPNLASRMFPKSEIVEMKSTEGILNLQRFSNDAIFDHYETGESARQNDLKIVDACRQIPLQLLKFERQ